MASADGYVLAIDFARFARVGAPEGARKARFTKGDSLKNADITEEGLKALVESGDVRKVEDGETPVSATGGTSANPLSPEERKEVAKSSEAPAPAPQQKQAPKDPAPSK